MDRPGSDPEEVRAVAATILQSRHEFSAAQRILERDLAGDPDNIQAWLTLSSIYLIQGDMDNTRKACDHLRDANALVMAGCTGAWATVNGHARQTFGSLGSVLQSQVKQSPAVMVWAHGLMADAATYLGEDARADSEFKQALQFAPGDNFLLADYGDFLLDHDRPKEALALTRNFSQSDTSYLRQDRADVALGLPSASKGVAAMASRFHDLEQRGDHLLYGREQARFVLELQHDPARALQIATNNWTVQRAPEDIRSRGVELGQESIVLPLIPLAFLVRKTRFYQVGLVRWGLWLIITISMLWLMQRVFDVVIPGTAFLTPS